MGGAGKIPVAPEARAIPLARNLARYRKLHLNGTPALLFPYGTKRPAMLQPNRSTPACIKSDDRRPRSCPHGEQSRRI